MENISALLGEVITKRGKDNISKEKDMEESLDYVDEKTNLLTCGHCHTAKEKLIDFMGDKKKVHISCKCMQEKEREEKEEAKKNDEMDIEKVAEEQEEKTEEKVEDKTEEENK